MKNSFNRFIVKGFVGIKLIPCAFCISLDLIYIFSNDVITGLFTDFILS